jgi:hypothetical protein
MDKDTHLLGVPVPASLSSAGFVTCLAGNHSLALPRLVSLSFPTFLMFISNTTTLKKSLFSRGSLCLVVESGKKHWSASLLVGLEIKIGGEEDFLDALVARW